jgi:hypothetical protein
MYALVLGFWHVIEYAKLLMERRRLVLDASLVYYVSAGVIATLIYIVIHILPDPAAYFSIPSQFFAPSLENETYRYARFLMLRPIELALLGIAIISAVYRRHPEDRHFLILIGSWIVLMPIIPPWVHYTNHMWPMLVIGLGGFFARGAKPSARLGTGRLYLGALLAVGILLFNVGLHRAMLQPSELREQLSDHPVLAYIRETVPEDTVVMAHSTHFYYLSNYMNFMSYRDADEHAVMQRGESQLDYWRREQPLVVVGDYRSDDPELVQYMVEMDFAEVFPDVWVAGSLREQPEPARP